MQNLHIIPGIALALLAACSSETVGPPPPVPANWQSLDAPAALDAGADIVTAKERAIPDNYAAAFASPGFAKLGAILDEDAHFASPGMDDAHGRDQVVHAHDVLLGAFDDRKLAISRAWRTPNEQTIEWTMTGVQTKDWMGISGSTHKAVGFNGVTLLWTRDDGSVSDVHLYVNVPVVKAQLGVGPKELLSLSPATPPSGSPQVFDQTGSADEKKNVAVVTGSLNALEGNNEAGYLDSMTDDVEVYTVERAAPAKGKADAKAHYRAMHKAIGQLDTTVDSSWGVAQFVVVEYMIDGEQLAPLWWIPKERDRVLRFETVDVCEITGGKIARIWRYDNLGQIPSSVLK